MFIVSFSFLFCWPGFLIIFQRINGIIDGVLATIFKKILFIYLFLEIGKERGKRGRETLMWERNIHWLPFGWALTGNQTHKLGMCLDCQYNPWPFFLWENVQPTEPHWPKLWVFVRLFVVFSFTYHMLVKS